MVSTFIPDTPDAEGSAINRDELKLYQIPAEISIICVRLNRLAAQPMDFAAQGRGEGSAFACQDRRKTRAAMESGIFERGYGM
jgi:hypothetical protein